MKKFDFQCGECKVVCAKIILTRHCLWDAVGKDFYLTRLSVAEGTFKKVYNLAASGFGIM